MDNLIASLSSMIKPDMVAALGKTLGADPAAVGKGLAAVGPIAMNQMAKLANTPGGAESLFKMLPEDGGGGFGNIASVIGGLMTGRSGETVNAVMGPGINSIGAYLSKALGFNVTPLLGLVVPALTGLIGKTAKANSLDANGLGALLTRQNADFAGDPANKATMALVNDATVCADKAATEIASYGASWSKVAGGPAAALLLVASSDLSGPLGSIKEFKAADAALRQSIDNAPPTSVMSAAFGAGLTETALNSVKALAKDKEALLRMITQGAAAFASRTPAEVQAYKDTIRAVAKATAEAAKEGGFLGIGGKLVSADEQAALDRIDNALA
jgi:hypothetical protein